MPVRILYIIQRIARGGTEKQLAALINGLAASTKAAAYLCTLQPSESLVASLPVPKIELTIRRLSNPGAAIHIKKLAGLCRHHRINVIHTFFQDPTLIGALLKIVLPVKLVVSFRDLGFWRSRAENIKMRLAYPLVDGFLANSQAVKTHFVYTDHIRPEKIEVIYNGFDCRRLAAAPPITTMATKHPTVGIVGNFNRPVKRMGDFIEAAALIKKEMNDVRFVIIGDGNQKNDLMRRCCELGIANAVVFTGRINEPLEKIRNFTVGVCTSESEGFSNAVLEYMACGLPVVVTDVGGNQEMVAHGINGFRTPVADPQALATHVLRLLCDPTLCRRMGEQNVKTVQGNYEMEKMVASHESYYMRLMGA